MVTVTYDLEATQPVDVQLLCSVDKNNINEVVATFPAKTPGSHTDYWDCSATNKIYGQFFFKVVAVPECVMINGVCWATRNVDMPGTFAANPEDAGMFYQWNRKVGWSSTDPLINSDGDNTWDDSIPPGTEWESANDPSPPGYRVPTLEELQTLSAFNVTYEWTTENDMPGGRFTDKANGNSIFLPAVGYRGDSNGMLYFAGTYGYYWSSTQSNTSNAYLLYLGSTSTHLTSFSKASGFSVRPVAE